MSKNEKTLTVTAFWRPFFFALFDNIFILNMILDNEEEGVSSHFRQSNSTVRGQDEPPIESESEVKLEQSIASSGSGTSSEDTATPWSQSGLAPPSLKSYSQTTLSDLDNDGNDETFFTEF